MADKAYAELEVVLVGGVQIFVKTSTAKSGIRDGK